MKSPGFFIQKLKTALAALSQVSQRLSKMDCQLDEIKINQGKILGNLNAAKTSAQLRDYEFSVFSQWGEDGIIQHLIRTVPVKNKTFIEFGVEDFLESNCRFLLMNNDWKGFVIDSSAQNISRLKQTEFHWKYHLEAVCSFITKENINALLAKSGFDEDLGILSVDIDGNDYHVLEAITFFKPRILICEYNAVFGQERTISIPYEPQFNRTDRHYSNLYYGASLAAMTHLAQRKGYTLVGTCSMGGNAFYVRNDLMNSRLEALTVEQAYYPSNVRESRNPEGQLSCLSGDARLELIKGMPVLNVLSNTPEII